MPTSRRLGAALLAAILCALAGPAQAARPLIDSGKWDAYFALFARDEMVPWKRISVRLDTYSGAPVDFSAYAVDPADVIVAGASSRPRVLDTAHRTPIARWRFTPPPGLRLDASDIEVPLANREGFYVIEARRGEAVQQVWLNLSRIGLVTKESPTGSLLYGADLGTGKALAKMRVSYLVGSRLMVAQTDAHGVSRVPARAKFALAEWGGSRAFVSLLPQSPPPSAIVGVRADRGVVRAGSRVRVVGFARRRSGSAYRPASGVATVALSARGRMLVQGTAALDRTGTFTLDLAIPAGASSGDAAIIATAAGASGGATVHIDATADATLRIDAPCASQCVADAPIALTITAKHEALAMAGRAVHVRVIRTPHVLPSDVPDDVIAWGTTAIIDTALTTDAAGSATLTIPAPSDGLPSTYGIEATSGAASASSRLVAPGAPLALSIVPDRSTIDLGEPVSLTVRGFDPIDGGRAANIAVRVRIAHGPTVQEQSITLSADGVGRATFRDVAPGTNFVSAQATVDGKTAIDLAAVIAAPRSTSGGSLRPNADVRMTFDHSRYRANDRVDVTASLGGAVGDAFVTMETAAGISTATVSTANGAASATLPLQAAAGGTSVGVVFVRDGALVDASRALAVDGPGHVRALELAADQPTYAAGATARITLHDGSAPTDATIAVRLSDRRLTGGAAFDDFAAALSANAISTQNGASEDPTWHAFVAPARSKAGDLSGSDRPRAARAPAQAISADDVRIVTWRVDRGTASTIDVVMPTEPGRYVLSLVKMTDDGDIGTATTTLTVQ